MKSFSKRVASFTMAAAMVLSLAAVSPVDAEAATAKITKKSSITAGKTYTYNVKNVTKSQYIKVRMSSGVTVKYNNKTVKKNSTKIKGGKTIALKVKAADKVANYKATLKAVIYNKKTNKKVKTLTTQSTVKCTKLEVKNVTVASTTGKYLVATFNKPLAKLSTADIEIRNLNTNELKGVEKVELASDGKSANITLVGSEDATAGTVGNNSFVEANVDYSFKVTQSGVTASTNFTVDAVAAYVTVSAVDPGLRKISFTMPLDKNTNITAAPGTVKLPESVNNDDFQDLLGTTVNVWFNKNNVATKLTRVNEDIIYGSFKYFDKNTATPYFQNKATNEKYYVSQAVGGSDVKNSREIKTRVSGGYTYAGETGLKFNNEDSFDYMKLVLYSNGTIRTAVYNQTFTDKLLVTKVEGNLVYSGDKYSVNFEGFTVLKDGKSASVKDINANDVVFVNTVNKFAEIYTTTKTGKIEATYDTQFKFDGTLYLNDSVKTIKDNAATPCNYDIMKAFVAGGADVTVYLDRANQPVFVMGTQKYAESKTETVILTDKIGAYNQALTDYIRIKGFDGKSTNTYDVAVGGLEWVEFTSFNATFENVKFVKDSGTATDAGAKDTDNKLKTHEFKLNYVAPGQTATNATELQTAGGKKIVAVNAGTPDPTNTVVEITKNDKGAVVGLTFKKSITPSGTDDPFVGGKSSITVGTKTYQIKADTPVFAYDDTGVNAGKNWKKLTYAEYSASTGNAKYWVYTGSVASSSTREVAYVVVRNNAVSSAVTYIDGVVGSILTNDNKATEVVLYNGATATTYKDFTNDDVRKAVAGAKAGAYINLGIAADGKTVVNVGTPVNLTGMISANMSVSSDNIKPGEGKFTAVSGNVATTYELAKNFTIVKRVSNLQGTPVYEKAEFSELGSLKKSDLIYIHKAATGFVDAVIIQY